MAPYGHAARAEDATIEHRREVRQSRFLLRPGIRGPWSAPAERHRLASRCAPCKGGNRASGIYRKLDSEGSHAAASLTTQPLSVVCPALPLEQTAGAETESIGMAELVEHSP